MSASYSKKARVVRAMHEREKYPLDYHIKVCTGKRSYELDLREIADFMGWEFDLPRFDISACKTLTDCGESMVAVLPTQDDYRRDFIQRVEAEMKERGLSWETLDGPVDEFTAANQEAKKAARLAKIRARMEAAS